MNYPEVRYYLSSESIGRVLLNFEPINWNEDDKQLIRNTDNWGVVTQLSNDLIFVKDGRELLQEIYEREGTEVEVKLERFVIESIDRSYELDYIGNLDMKTYVLDNEKVSIEFLTGGLQSLVESQFDEAYELQRLTDINGGNITALEYKNIYWEGRRIFLNSKTKVKDSETNRRIYHINFGITTGFPFNFTKEFASEGINVNNVLGDKAVGLSNLSVVGVPDVESVTASSFFFINTELDFIEFRLKSSYSFKHNIRNGVFPNNQSRWDNNYKLALGYAVFEFIDSEWIFVRKQTIKLFNGLNGNPDITSENNDVRTQGSFDDLSPLFINLTRNQAIIYTLFPLFYTEIRNLPTAIDIYDFNFNIELEQNSTFQATEFKGIRLYDAFERMLEIYTGQIDRIKSSYFKYGEFKNVLLSSGTQIRNLPTVRENQNLPVSKLTVELKDLFETNNYFNLGWSIENHNNKEFYVIEDKTYFFVDFPLIDLGEISKLKISCAEEFLYKSGTFGNSKAGDYEELQGLQEYNALTTYQTHLKTADNKYEVEGKIRADLIGAELARRKNFAVAPSEDTRYDNENFLFDCKIYEGTKFTPKVWQDSLSQQPICYDPESAGNLLLTPFRSMERHSRTFGAGLTKYPNKFVRYSSGTGKVQVATKIEGEPIRFENSNIINSELKKPDYEAEYYEFESPLNTAIRRKLRESTLYNERLIPNTNFLIKFTSKRQEYFGYIIQVGFNDPGNWKLIKKNV